MNAAIRAENEILLAGAFKESFGLALNVRFAAGIEKGAGAMIKTTHQRGAWLKEGAGFFKRINFFHVHIPVYLSDSLKPLDFPVFPAGLLP